MKYRKKPVIIEAVQLSKSNLDEVKNFVNEKGIIKYWGRTKGELCLVGYEVDYAESWEKVTIDITTLEGVMRADENDYIIKGIKGEFYPCKSDIFEQTYEKVEG